MIIFSHYFYYHYDHIACSLCTCQLAYRIKSNHLAAVCTGLSFPLTIINFSGSTESIQWAGGFIRAKAEENKTKVKELKSCECAAGIFSSRLPWRLHIKCIRSLFLEHYMPGRLIFIPLPNAQQFKRLVLELQYQMMVDSIWHLTLH